MLQYSINLTWSDEDRGFIATIPEFPNLSAFGKTREEALKEAEQALAGFVEVLKEDKEQLPIPNTLSNYSGQLRIRMPKQLHRALAIAAEREGVSLNTHMVHLLSISYGYGLGHNKMLQKAVDLIQRVRPTDISYVTEDVSDYLKSCSSILTSTSISSEQNYYPLKSSARRFNQ